MFGYNFPAAVLELDRLMQARMGYSMSLADQTDYTGKCAPILAGVPSLWRLTTKDDPQEVVFNLQGVLCNFDLPPLKGKISANTGRARFLRQAITLTGYGSYGFDQALNQVAALHSVFERKMGREKMLELQVIGTYAGYPTIEVSNRYFSARSEVPHGEEIEFDSAIDPEDNLKRCGGDTLVHCEDNRVQYFERKVNEAGLDSYHPAEPVLFQRGDIVEAQLSFVSFPVKGGKFRSTLVLRALTLLDSSFTQAARMASIYSESAGKRMNAAPILKRVVGYADDLGAMQRKNAKKTEGQSAGGSRDNETAKESGDEQSAVAAESGGQTAIEGSGDQAGGAGLSRGEDAAAGGGLGDDDAAPSAPTNGEEAGMDATRAKMALLSIEQTNSSGAMGLQDLD